MFTIRSVKTKILALSLIAVLVTAVVIVGMVLLQRGGLKAGINGEVLQQGRNEIKAVSTDIYTLCQTTDELVRYQVQSALELAKVHISTHGSPRLTADTVTWRKPDGSELVVPRVMFGGTWLGQSRNMSDYIPVVDDVFKSVGIHCSIFQRINEQGDMLRIASSANQDGQRLTGSISPAVNPDGSPNKGLQKVISGESHTGVTQLTGSLKITTFEPFYDDGGRVIGMIACGFDTSKIATLRDSILSTVVGKTGAVSVFQGSGSQRGNYIISPQGARDGENALDLTDLNGEAYIQKITETASGLSEGEIVFCEHPLLNESTGRNENELTACIYYAPWDWVITAGTFESDYQEALVKVDGMISALILWVVIAAIVIIILVAVVSLVVSNRIAGPIGRAAAFADAVADGDLTQSIDCVLHDEVGRLINSLNRMNNNLNTMVVSIGTTAYGLAESSEELNASSSETSRTVQGVARAIEEVDRASHDTTRSLADSEENMRQTAQAVEGISTDIEQVAVFAHQAATQGGEGLKAAESAVKIINQAAGSVRETAQVVESLGEKTAKIGGFIEIITGIADQTNLLALNAAIEAARAGEAGRGFAVVAEEVRKLAEESNRSAGSITELVKVIEGEMKTALDAMQQSDREVEEGSETVQQAGQLLAEIVSAVDAVSEKVNNVSAAAQEINASAQEVLDSLKIVSEVAQKNSEASEDVSSATTQQAAAMEEITEAAGSLSAMAQQLEEMVQRFKVRSGS